MPDTTRERKVEQRRRDRLAGWTEVSVRVSADRVDELRRYAATLPPPATFAEQLEARAQKAREDMQEICDLAREHAGEEIDPAQMTSDPVVLAALK